MDCFVADAPRNDGSSLARFTRTIVRATTHHDRPPHHPLSGPSAGTAAQPVTVFDGALRDLARDLLETMHAATGIGITAPHIGILLRVVVNNCEWVMGFASGSTHPTCRAAVIHHAILPASRPRVRKTRRQVVSRFRVPAAAF